MSRYFYVVAHLVGDGTEESPTMISFRHVNIEADSIEDAYTRGPELLGKICPEFSGRFVNDYVIKIPEGGSNGMV